MKFAKDILLIDFEGFDEPIQLGAILLDKDTLAEKSSFISYIHADLKGEDKIITGITQEMLDPAPTQAQVGRMLFDKFGTDVLIACWVSNLDMAHFKKIMTAADMDIRKYDYHVLDIWPIAYAHLVKKGYTGSMRSEEMFHQFGAAPRGLHDGLEDCRLEADILRKIIFE